MVIGDYVRVKEGALDLRDYGIDLDVVGEIIGTNSDDVHDFLVEFEVDGRANLEFKLKESEVVSVSDLKMEHELAEYLHDHFCSLDHTTECSWLYEKSNPNTWSGKFSAHSRWLEKAEKMLSEFEYDGKTLEEMIGNVD